METTAEEIRGHNTTQTMQVTKSAFPELYTKDFSEFLCCEI